MGKKILLKISYNAQEKREVIINSKIFKIEKNYLYFLQNRDVPVNFIRKLVVECLCVCMCMRDRERLRDRVYKGYGYNLRMIEMSD